MSDFKKVFNNFFQLYIDIEKWTIPKIVMKLIT